MHNTILHPLKPFPAARNRLAGLSAVAAVLLALVRPASAAPPTYQSTVIGDTPFLYYELGEASGTTATDMSGNGYNGTYSNTNLPYSSANNPILGVPGDSIIGPSDTAVSFNALGRYLVGPASMESFGTSLPTSSFEFVFKVPAAGSSTSGMLMGTRNSGTSEVISIALNENYAGSSGFPNQIRIFVRDASGTSSHNVEAAFTNAAAFDGNYHHMVWTYSAPTTITAYLDGVPQVLDQANATAVTTWANFTYPIGLACYNGAGSGGLANSFTTPIIDEFAMYNYVLTPTQVATHYAAVGINEATWVGGTDNNFATPANWSPAAPVSLNTLVFGNISTTTALNNNESGFIYTGLLFTNTPSAYSITGNPFTLAGPIANASATAAQSIANNITLTNWTAANWTVPVSDAGGGTTLSGAISGPYGLTKTGVGTLTLSGTDTYTGGTTNNAGTLAVNGSLTGGVTVNSGASLAGTGTIAGAVTLNSGAILAPGNSGIGALSVGSLTLNAGAINNFEFNGGGNDQVICAGTLTVNGGAFNLYLPGGTTPFTTPGTYTLVQYAGADPALDSTWTTASASNPHVLNPVATYSYQFTASGGALKLIIVSTAVVNHVWTSPVSGNWSLAGNWTPSEPHSPADLATLGIGTALQTVTLDTPVSVGYLGLTNAHSFVIANDDNTLTLDNTNGGAKINVIAGTANAIQAPVSLNDNATIVVSGGDSLVLGNVLSSTSSAKTLTVSGVGALTLSGANTYGPAAGTVGTTISGAGLVQVGSSTALAAGDVSISANATLQAGAAGVSLNNNLILGPGVTFTADNNGYGLTLNGILSGSASLTEIDSAGADTLTLNGVNTYTGGTTISTGTLVIGGAGELGGGVYAGAITNNGVFTYASTAAQTLSGNITGTGALNVNAGAVTLTATNSYSGNTTVSTGSLTIGATGLLGGSIYTGLINITNNGSIAFNGTGSQFFAGGVTGPGVLYQGAGTLNLNGPNTYTGGSVVSGNGALIFATAPTTGTVTLNNFAAVTMTGALPATVVNGTNSITSGGNTPASVGILTLNGTVNLGAGGTGTFQLTGATTGSGTIILGNRPGSDGSTGMQLGFNGSTGASGLILNMGTTNATALVASSATAIALGGLVGGPYTQLSGGSAAVTYTIGGANTNTEFDGIIANGAATVSLTKVGAGVLTLTNVNTYSGLTTVSNGTLVVNTGSLAGAVQVAATAVLGGSGTIAGPITVQSGGITFPGAAATGGVTATINGNVTYNAGGVADFNVGASTSGGFDQIVVNGTLTGANVSVGVKFTGTPGGNLSTSGSYPLFQVNGTLAGSFNPTPVWLGTPPANASQFYILVSGNNVVLAYSPIKIVSAAASPNPASHGQWVTLTIGATAGGYTINPGSGIYVNAGSLGGSSQLYLVQSNGSSLYTNNILIPANIGVGAQTLSYTISDSNGDTVNSAILLTLVGAAEVWDGNASPDNTWGNGLNWADGLAPSTGDFVTLAGTKQPTTDLETSYSIASLTFAANAGRFNITNVNNTLTLTGGGVTNNSAYAQTVGVPVALAGTNTFAVTTGNLVISNSLSDGNGGGGLAVVGGNTLILSGYNSYSGSTTVGSNSILQAVNLPGGNALSGGSTLNLNSGSTLQLRSDSTAQFSPAGVVPQNAADTLNIDVGPVTAGITGQTLTLNGTLAFADSQVNQTINVTGTGGYTLVLGNITATAGSSHNPYQMVDINVIPGITAELGSFTTGNWGDFLNFSGGGNAVFTGTFSNTSDGSGILTVNGGTTVTFEGTTVKANTGDAYSYLVQNGTLVADNNTALINDTSGTTDNAISFFILGPATNVVTPGSTSLPTGFQTINTNNSVNCAFYLGDANNNYGGLSVAATVTNNVSDGDVGFTNNGVMTIGGQNTSGVNTFNNPIILGWTTNRGKGVTLVAAPGGEVDFAGPLLANGTDRTAGITVGAPGFTGLVKLYATTNTYYGPTIINYGTLALADNGNDAYIANSASIVINAGTVLDVSAQYVENATFPLGTGAIAQTLSGSGSLNGSLTVGSLGTVAPGPATTLGTLTVSNNVTLGGNLVLKLSNASGTKSDHLVVSPQNGGTLTYGGTLTVTNIGPALVQGNKFQLFPGAVTSFSNITLPVSDNNYRYTWNNQVASNGSITLQSATLLVNTNPATANFQGVPGANNTLHFTWAADHQGWQLYTNSVGLTSPGTWYPWAGSAGTTSETITINPAQPQVFFQLRYP